MPTAGSVKENDNKKGPLAIAFLVYQALSHPTEFMVCLC